MPRIDRELAMLTEWEDRQVYLGRKQLSQVQGLRGVNWPDWMERNGRLINPDVEIGILTTNRVRGWYGPRWLDWLTSAGRIDHNGHLISPEGKVGGPRPRLSAAEAERLRSMARDGVSVTQIARELEMPTSSVYNYLRRQDEQLAAAATYPDPADWQVKTRRYLSSTELAERLGIAPGVIHVWLQRGHIAPSTIIVGDPRTVQTVRYGWSTQDCHDIERALRAAGKIT